MARPKLTADTKLSKRFIFRLSESELATLVAAAEVCGASTGKLVREKLFKGKFPKAATPRLDVLHYSELKKIGVNLNQLTRLCHSGRMPGELLVLLLRLEQRLDTTIAKLIHDRHTKDR